MFEGCSLKNPEVAVKGRVNRGVSVVAGAGSRAARGRASAVRAAWAVTGVVGAVVLGLGGAAARGQITQYKVVDLSGGGQFKSYRATAISPNGQYITTMAFDSTPTGQVAGGYSYLVTGYQTGSTGFASLPTVPGLPGYVNASGVNDLGQVAGTVGGSNNRGGNPVVWNNGTAYLLGLPEGYGTPGSFNFGGSTYGINAMGMVGGGIGAGTPRGIIWYTQTNGDGSVTTTFPYQVPALPAGGVASSVFALSESGWFAGTGLDPANASRTVGYVVDDGGNTYGDIGPGLQTTIPFAINSSGKAVGSASISGVNGNAFQWTAAGGISALPMVRPGNSSSARAINDAGLIAGIDSSAGVQGNVSTGFVSDGTRTFYLKDLAGLDGVMNEIQSPFGVSNGGVIVGQMYFGQLNGPDVRAFALLPVAGTSASMWTASGSGLWGDATWNNGVASGTTTQAIFSQSITAASTVTLEASRTVQGLSLNSNVGYTIASTGGAVLTLQSGNADNAKVAVSYGSHDVSAAVNFASQTDLGVRTGYTLTFSGTLTATASPNVAGPGLVVFTGNSAYSVPTIVSGGTFRAADGTALPVNSVLRLMGGVYETSGTFTRALGTSGASRVSWPVGATGGLSAFGAPLTVNIGGNATPSTLAYGDPAFSPSAITLNGLLASHPLTFLNPVQLGGQPFTINVLSPTQPATLAGALTGTGDVIKDGVGTLILSSPANNYLGTMTVNGGTLRLASGSGLSGSVTVNPGGTFDPTAVGTPFAMSPTQTVTLVSGGTLVGNLSGTGTAAFTGGAQTVTTVISGSAAVRVASGPTTLAATNSYTGPTTVVGGTLRAAQGMGLPAASNLTLAGGAYELAGTFSRTLGAGAGQVQLTSGVTGFSASGGALAVSIGGVGTPTPLTWGSASFNPAGLLLNAASADSALSFGNAIALGSAVREFRVDANVATITGNLTGNAASGVNKTGPGVLVLAGTNTYGGPTIVTGGTLRFGPAGLPSGSNLALTPGVLESSGSFNRALGTGGGQVQLSGDSGFSAAGGAFTVNLGGAGATLTWGQPSFTIGSLQLGSPTADSALTFVNPVDLASAVRTINSASINPAAVSTLSGGLLGDGSAGLVKTGPGVVAVTGASTYSGPTLVTGGALRVTDGVGLPTASQLALSGGVLESSGTFARNTGFGSGLVSLTGTSGFSASGSPLTVTLNGGSSLTWGLTTESFAPSLLVLNAASASAPLTLTNPLSYGGTRTVRVDAGTATLTGTIGVGAGGVLAKTGPGRLVLTGIDVGFAGALRITAGTLALGPGANFTSDVVVNGDNASFDPTGQASPYVLANGKVINVLASNFTLVGNVSGPASGTSNLTYSGTGSNSYAGNLSGLLQLRVSNGTVTFTGTNTQTLATQANGGILRGNLSPNSNLSLGGGVYEWNGTFSRALGTAAGQVTFVSGVTTGLSAFGGTLTVNLGGNVSPSTLNFNAANFQMTTLVLNQVSADSPLVLRNPLSLNAFSLAAQRNLFVGANTATLAGGLTGIGTLIKSGNGTLLLSTTNSTTGNLIVTAGTLALGATGTMNGVTQVTVSGTGSLDVSAKAPSYAIPVTQTLTFTDTGNLIGNVSGAGNVVLAPSAGNMVITGNLGQTSGLNVVAASTNLPTGSATLAGSLTYTGNTVVSAPSGRLTFASAWRPVTNAVSVTATGASVTFAAAAQAGSSTVVAELSGLSVASGASAAVAPTDLSTSVRRVLVTSALDLTSTGPGTFGGTLDLGNNDMIVRNGDLSAVRSMVRSWLTGSGGLKSSVAGGAGRDAYATLAVVRNSSGFGFPLFGTFDGVNVGANDVLVRYTYAGDTNLDGRLDARDFSAVLNGWSNGLTGWQNGDIDYNGIVDASDFATFMSAYTNQGVPFEDAPAGAGAIPEPELAALLAAPLLLAGRRRRR